MAGIAGIAHSIRNFAVMTPGLKQIYDVGNIYQNYDLAKMILPKIPGVGKLADPVFKTVDSIGSAAKKSLMSKVPVEHHDKVNNVFKGIDKINKAQMGVDMASFGASILTGNNKGEMLHSAEKRMNKQMNPSSLRYSGELRPLRDSLIKGGSLLENATPEEIDYLFQECTKRPDLFFLKGDDEKKILYKNLHNQTTKILKENDNIVAFINYGKRELYYSKPNCLYIRTVYVPVEFSGKGIATKVIKFVLDSIDKKEYSDGIWIQICSNNIGMKNAVKKNNFRKIDDWFYNDSKAEIWFKDIK